MDAESRKWSHVESVGGVVPESRSFHTATSVGRKVIVFGGRGTTNQHFSDLHVFDIGQLLALTLKPFCLANASPYQLFI